MASIEDAVTALAMDNQAMRGEITALRKRLDAVEEAAVDSAGRAFDAVASVLEAMAASLRAVPLGTGPDAEIDGIDGVEGGSG